MRTRKHKLCMYVCMYVCIHVYDAKQAYYGKLGSVLHVDNNNNANSRPRQLIQQNTLIINP